MVGPDQYSEAKRPSTIIWPALSNLTQPELRCIVAPTEHRGKYAIFREHLPFVGRG